MYNSIIQSINIKERQAFEPKGVYGTLLGDHFRVSIGESIGSKVKDMRKNMRGVMCREMKKWKVLEAMMYAKLSPPPDSRTSSQKRKSADSFRKDKKVQDLVAKANLDKKGGKLKITILKKLYHHTVANMCDALQHWLKQTGRLQES